MLQSYFIAAEQCEFVDDTLSAVAEQLQHPAGSPVGTTFVDDSW